MTTRGPIVGRVQLLLLGLSLATSAAAQPNAAERSVDSLFAAYNEGVRPGLAVAVVQDGRRVFARGYGMATLEHRVRITPSTVFDVASVSKQFAGLAIAMLVDQGRLRLSDDVRKYIPELGDVGHTITIDHLVHHTSGLRDWPGSLSLAGWRMDDVIAFDQILRFAYAQRSLNFPPGSEYTYSNTGYNLLAEVVARVSGRSFRQFVQERLFAPLGIERSHFHDNVTEVVADRATGYARAPDGWRAATDNLSALGSSSLFATVEDLAKWVANFDDARVGGKPAMALARTRGKLNDGSTIPYAFGLVHGEYRGRALLQHSGSWAQFATFVVHFPELRAGVIVLANSGSINAARAAYDVADAFLGPSLGARSTVADSLATAPAVTVAPTALDRYAGLYRLGPGWYVRIARSAEGLTTQATREAVQPMSARSDTSFWVAGYSAAMAFTNLAAGPVTLVYRGRRHPRLDETRAKAPTLDDYVGDYQSAELGAAYRIEITNSALAMTHYRHGSTPLTHLWGDDFGGAAWYTRSVEFLRDAHGAVTGFSVFVDERSRDVRFTKISR
jgi:CubicO group peptidase (beta-lactamase class C family)